MRVHWRRASQLTGVGLWRKDLVRWLSGKEYLVNIATGNRRGAGTTAQVFVELQGRKGRTGKIDVEGVFERDTTTSKRICTDTDLGPIRAVHVGHDNVGGPGVGWYLESVELEYDDVSDKGEAQRVHLKFPVRRWLGKSDLGRGTYPSSVSLKVGIMDSMTDPLSLSVSEMVLESINRKPLFVETGVAAFPHPDKVREGQKAFVRSDVGQAGEDAYSIAVVEHPDPTALEKLRKLPEGSLAKSHLPTTLTITVADGVFSWRNQGIDAGEWSRFLVRVIRHQMQHHVRDVDELPSTSEKSVDKPVQSDSDESPWHETYRTLGVKVPVVPLRHPLEALMIGEKKIRETGIKGSSTACVASIHGLNRTLYVANLGDSGLMVYRPNFGILFRTPEQEHNFGYPYQLGHHEASDHAKDAMVSNFMLTEGDVVIVASDGLFDNLDETDIVRIVSQYAPVANAPPAKMSRKASKCAFELASAAFKNSVDPHIQTPWSINAAEEFDLAWRGGKMDDITVVCALIN